MTDELPFDPPEPESARTAVRLTPRACIHRPLRLRIPYPPELGGGYLCTRCGRRVLAAKSRAGSTYRTYGNRAELSASRTYGGVKTGHHGGPVDIRGKDFQTQMRTHRRKPPQEWTKALNAMAADGTRIPRLLLRFVFPGGPDDYWVIPAKAWLDWYGRDE